MIEGLEIAIKNKTTVLASTILDALIELSKDKEFADAFVNSRGMPLLSETMDVFNNEETVLTKITTLIQLLGQVTGKIEKGFNSKIYKQLINVLNMHPEMKELALAALDLMSVAIGDPKLLDLLATTGSIAAVQQILSLHSDCEPLVQACDAIMLASGNADFENLTANEATDQLRSGKSKAMRSVCNLSLEQFLLCAFLFDCLLLKHLQHFKSTPKSVLY